MEVVIVLLFVVAIFFAGLAIWAELSNRKEAMSSGMCSHCKKVQATKKLPKGGYVCKECYQKIAPAQNMQIQRERQAERDRLAEEKPVVVKAIHGTSGLYDSFTGGLSDYAGGWDVNITVSSRSPKTIKYVIAELIPYNTVGDVGYSPTVGAGAKNIQITGPIHPYGKLKDMRVKKCWYDIQMARIGVGTVRVIFMDGTEKTFRQE